MDILREQNGDILGLTVSGRLDAYWSDHLSQALEEAVRGGVRHVRMDLSGLSFLSSVGIRVLLRAHKQLRQISGSFVVVQPSETVMHVLRLAGLTALLGLEERRESPEPTAGPTVRRFERAGARFEVHPLTPSALLTCSLLGNPEPLSAAGYAARQCTPLRCDAGRFGLGVGAFGDSFEDCRGRFGEFLFAGGAAMYLPSDGSNVPDFIARTGDLVAEVEALYAIQCEGSFAHLLRFESAGGDAIGLGALVSAALEAAEADSVGFTLVAESAGLVGAALRKSPVSGPPDASLFEHPAVREWISFTPERAFSRGVALAAGVASRGNPGALTTVLRPLAEGIQGHVHAAAFTYRPLPAGLLDLDQTVGALCERQQLQGVLHLLHDDRPIVGSGESAFARGALWVAPLDPGPGRQA